MRVVARVTPELRRRIDGVADELHLGNADTLRLLIVFGLGGSHGAADALNRKMAKYREQREREAGRERRPHLHEGAAERAPIVNVRLPGYWAAKVRGKGKLAAVIEAGLEKI